MSFTIVLILENFMRLRFHLRHLFASLSEYSFVILSITLNQSTDFQPMRRFQNTLLQLWRFASIVLTTVYVAQLVSILTVKKDAMRVDSLEDFLHNTQFKLYIEKDSLNFYRLRDSESGLLHDVWQAIQAGRGGAVTLSEALSLVDQDPNNVLLMGTLMLQESYETSCQFQKRYIGKTTYFPLYVALPLSKKYKYNYLVNRYIDSLISGGLFKHMKAKYTNAHCGADAIKESNAAFLIHFEGTFLLLLVGLILSMFVLILNLTLKHITTKTPRI